MRGEGRFDGVFGLWYGKGPGVDRCGDVLPPRQSRGNLAARRRARADGRRPHRRILDHRASVRIRLRRRDDADPVAGRRAGNPRLWRARLGAEPLRRRLGRHQMHQGHDRIDRRGRRLARPRRPGRADRLRAAARRPQHPHARRHPRAGSAAAGAQARRGGRLARRQQDQPDDRLRRRRTPKIGIITAGKSYLDVRQALDDLGIDEARCNALGLRLFKLGCAWPVVPARSARIRARARPHHRRRGEALADRSAGARGALRLARPADLHRQEATRTARWLFPVKGALDPNKIGIAIGERLLKLHPDERARRGASARLAHARAALAEIKQEATRTPYFCSGCPHNRSTVIPEGARAYAGIGCHFMAQFMDRAHRRLHADGRRGRQLGRRGAFLDARPRVPESRRRHLQPFRARWRCAGRSIPRSTSPTRSCSTTPSR